ncbi:hypothetical protein QE380_001599 [Acinetobacter baylyi]|uniref:Uncharacterized protein n=1 Tax=Acinetobacter baylyi TaxID=202950 RepID=A0ABU0UW95_ACIBI|nr:hypothetical protein [Acinetobacter baylyi]MDQ1208676.1 hypothetical protein [Acinetobacter baylyi]MDR6107732.1 hypothetical protein [Acinetobacter baylyi]MDR6185550.1 hypothetical protein [Acinetobacter baylyi]
MLYKAKFRILLKDRYAQSVGFWGAKYRIVDSEGGANAVYCTDQVADKDGFTIDILTNSAKKYRLELINLNDRGNYEIPTYEVGQSEVKTALIPVVKTIQVEKGFFRMRITDPFGNHLDKHKFEYKIISREKDKNGRLIVLRDWSDLKEPGYTHVLTIKKGFISFDSSIDIFRSIFYTRPYVDVYLRHKITKLETKKEERIIAYGSDKAMREWKLDKNALSATTKPQEEKSKAKIQELKFSRDIKVLLSLKKGRTYVAKREDGLKLFTNDFKETNAINWQDGQQVTFKVPGRYNGKILISVKDGKDNGKLIDVINIGALDSKIYKSSDIPKEIKLIKQPLSNEEETKTQDFNKNEYVQYCINMGYTGVNKSVTLNDMKDPKKCTDKEFKNIWQSIKSTFSFNNSATWWNISAGVVGASLDVSKRVTIIDTFFIPFFNILGVAATQAKFIIRNIGNHNGLFFIGSIIGRAHFNLKLFSKNAKDVLTARLPKEQMFDFSPKATIKGSFVGMVVGGTMEIQKWIQNENNQKDITDLLANLTGMAIKTIIGTWLTVLLASMILSGGPVGLIIAVGVVIGIAIGWFLDYIDEYFGMTDSLKNLYNHLQNCTQSTLQNMVHKGNQFFGLNYVLPSWFF